ncbi:MAG: hypothetical protein FWH31_10580 [Streptococcaceae bacterium]|nr:hypothetical protein [Streptococcaceae bacterium]
MTQKLTKKIKYTGTTALLLVSALLPMLNLSGLAHATTKERVAQTTTIDSVSKTPDYGTIGSTGGYNGGFLGASTNYTFNPGKTTEYTTGNMPFVSGTTYGLQQQTPAFSGNTSVLASTDNPAGQTINALINNINTTSQPTYGGGAEILDSAIDWKSDFSMAYSIAGANAYANTGTGLMFTPLSPTDLQTYMNGGMVSYPLKGAGGTAQATYPGYLQNVPIASLPNAFGLFVKGTIMAMLYANNTGALTTYANTNPVPMIDPSNLSKTFSWASPASAYTYAGTLSATTTPVDFTNAYYKLSYVASSRVLTVTRYTDATYSTVLPLTSDGNYTVYSGTAQSSPAKGTTFMSAFTTTIPTQLVGQTYSLAFSRTLYNAKGIGTGSWISGTNTYTGMPLTTSVTLNAYSFSTPTANLTVNYVDENNNVIKSATTLGANVGSTIGINPDTASAFAGSPNYAQDAWSYNAPVISGYVPVSANDVDVKSDSSSVLTITYHKVAVAASASFNFQYAAGALNTPDLPATVTQTGNVGDVINAPNLTVPAGYAVSNVQGPDGGSYDSISSALTANATMTNVTNNFLITLAPTLQTANFKFAFDSSQSNDSNPPALPATITVRDLTGNAIADPTSQVSAAIPAGYSIASVSAPDGTKRSNLTDALTTHPNYTATSNDFTIVLSYEGSLSLYAPDTIDFGTNSVSNLTQNLSGGLNQDLTVIDTRNASTISDWTVSVSETSPIQEIDDAGNPVAGGVSFEGNLYFGDSPLFLGQTLPVHSETSLGQGMFNLSEDWTAQQGFWLKADVDQQKSNANFQGTLTWTIGLVP